jgi:hypothetical protein
MIQINPDKIDGQLQIRIRFSRFELVITFLDWKKVKEYFDKKNKKNNEESLVRY